MEDAIGRPLLHTEHVHHIDGNRANNALDNLQLLDTALHARITHTRRPPVLHCWSCGWPIPTTRRTIFRVGDSPAKRHVFCCKPCFWDWLRAIAAARRNNLPLPTKAPICPLEDLLFPT
jgi:hypothetical protein